MPQRKTKKQAHKPKIIEKDLRIFSTSKIPPILKNEKNNADFQFLTRQFNDLSFTEPQIQKKQKIPLKDEELYQKFKYHDFPYILLEEDLISLLKRLVSQENCKNTSKIKKLINLFTNYCFTSNEIEVLFSSIFERNPSNFNTFILHEKRSLIEEALTQLLLD